MIGTRDPVGLKHRKIGADASPGPEGGSAPLVAACKGASQRAADWDVDSAVWQSSIDCMLCRCYQETGGGGAVPARQPLWNWAKIRHSHVWPK